MVWGNSSLGRGTRASPAQGPACGRLQLTLVIPGRPEDRLKTP